MSETLCAACARPVGDQARICATCTARLARDLGDVGALAGELQTTRLRQSRTGGQATGVLSRAYERPLPWDQRASEASDVLRSTVVGWVRVVLEERGARLPDDTMQAMATFLLAHLEWLRHANSADECADEMRHAVALAYRTIDSAPGRLYVGPCDPQGIYGESVCPTDLYAREGAAEVTCRVCDLIWDVQGRRQAMLDVAGDQLVTAADLSRFLSLYGEPLTAERIRQWSSRGQIAEHGKTPDGRSLYRVSEVTDRLAESGRKRTA